LAKLKVEEKVVGEETGKAQRLNNWLSRQIDQYSVPEVGWNSRFIVRSWIMS
jgi:hypothetical protein